MLRLLPGLRLISAFPVHSSSFSLEWFASDLSDRYQSVIVDGIVSASSPLVYGVPQGFVLTSGTCVVHVVLPASVECNFC